MSFPFAPPQGYPSSGGSALPVKVATGTVTSGSGSFIVSGTTKSMGSLTITPPSNASTIVAVQALMGGSTTLSSNSVFACPQGYADGATSTVLAIQCTADDATDFAITPVSSGGDLSFATASVVVPWKKYGQDVQYALYYQ